MLKFSKVCRAWKLFIFQSGIQIVFPLQAWLTGAIVCCVLLDSIPVSWISEEYDLETYQTHEIIRVSSEILLINTFLIWW